MSHVSSSGGADVAYLERDEDLGDSATLTAIAAKRRLDPQSTRKTQEWGSSPRWGRVIAKQEPRVRRVALCCIGDVAAGPCNRTAT